MKLQMKILLPIIGLIMLLLGVSSYLSYRQASESLYSSLVDNMRGEAMALVRATNTLMSDALRDMDRNAANEAVLDFYAGDIHNKANSEQMSDVLERIAGSYTKFDWIILLDAEGTVVAASNRSLIGNNYKQRDYYTRSIKGETFLSAPFKSSVDGKGVMTVSAPVKLNNQTVGVLYGTLLLDRLNQVAVAPVKVGNSGYAYILDESGMVVAAKDQSMLFNPNLGAMAHYKRWVAATEDGPDQITGNDGNTAFAYYAKDKLSKLTAIVRADYDDIFSGVIVLRNTSLAIAGAAILLGFIVVFLIVRPIVKALDKGVVFATQVAAGKLDGKLDVQRKDEIGQLAEALRAIPESLNAIVQEYAELEAHIVNGRLNANGDESKFSGDFAGLVHGTNAIMHRFCIVLDNIPSPVGIFSKDLKATYLNAAGQEAAGTDYLGKTDKELMNREDAGPDDALMRAISTGQRASAETVAHPRGLNLDVSYTAIPMRDASGNITAVLQLVTDLTEIKKTQRTIIEVANQALDIANRVAAASEELSAQVDQVNQGTEVQRDRAGSTATAMEEMNSTVLEVARNAGQSREQAEAMQGKANQGANMVRQVIAAIKQVNDVATELESNMQTLGQQAESIGSVMSVISDIADQTNLLALNAAIEAARAGEAGRGFAVVADEVRKLAEKTMGATSEVGSSITGIQTSTANNIQRVSDAAEGVVKATGLANDSGDALAEILELASANAALISGIATAAEEQSATSEEINRAVDEINRIAGETAQGMGESALAVQELSRMAQELNQLLDRLKA